MLAYYAISKSCMVEMKDLNYSSTGFLFFLRHPQLSKGSKYNYKKIVNSCTQEKESQLIIAPFFLRHSKTWSSLGEGGLSQHPFFSTVQEDVS